MKSKISIQNVAVTKQCIDVTYTYTSGLLTNIHNYIADYQCKI